MKKFFEKSISKKYLIIVLVAGILMMLLPGLNVGERKKENNINSFQKIDENKLKKIIEKIDGVEQADIFITYLDQGSTDYAYEISNSNNKNDLKIKLNDKQPVVYRNVNPKIGGILLVIKGSAVKESELCNVIKGATGVPLHRISVVISGGA